MNVIEPHDSWLALEARAASTENPLHKQLLTEVRDHMAFEIKGDLEPLMGTLIAEPLYHFWRDEPFTLEGAAAVRGFYENMMASKANQFQVVTDRIFVDDAGVITEGQVKQVYRGPMVTAMGIDELDGARVSEDDLILTTTQLLTVWPAGEGAKLVGEDIYFGHNPFLHARRISRSDLPDYYLL
jgi:hypothetical protein